MEITDKDRLDFLIENECYIEEKYYEFYCMKIYFMDDPEVIGKGKTPRESIDNAIMDMRERENV